MPARRPPPLVVLCAATLCAALAPAAAAQDGAAYRWRPLPPSLLFKPFIAGVKAPRMSAEVLSNRGGRTGDATLDATLGARLGLMRYGQAGPDANGWQLDVQAAAFTRLNGDEEMDVDATDFRAGVPLSYRRGGTAVSFGYDHISTHMGDEFLERHPRFQRVNYSRDALLLSVRQRLNADFTVYGEAAWAFYQDGGSEPWAFQSGLEFFRELSPTTGGPVAAVNSQLRQEHDFGGRFTSVAGWQWRNPESGRLLRLAAKYETGKSRYYELFGEDETAVGIGLFYDF